MNSIENDILTVVERIAPHCRELRSQKLLLTGGTGFFGRWLIESFLRANREYGLNASLWIVSRSPQRFLKSNPHLISAKEVNWIEGDVRNFEFRKERFSYVIHAATDVFSPLPDPAETIDVGLSGTRRIIELCRATGTERLLLVSSGAVYGHQPLDIEKVPETYLGPPALTSDANAYTLSKRLSEWLVLNSSPLKSTQVSIARCFAFAGPMFPIDGPFALSDFTRRILDRKVISIQGDGTTLRSYMDGVDLATWLWHLLFKGPDREAVNVGSDEPISIFELAKHLVEIAETDTEITVAQKANNAIPERYIPSIEKARQLGLELKVSGLQAIRRTFEYHRNQRS